jgi:hypothetical protein
MPPKTQPKTHPTASVPPALPTIYSPAPAEANARKPFVYLISSLTAASEAEAAARAAADAETTNGGRCSPEKSKTSNRSSPDGREHGRGDDDPLGLDLGVLDIESSERGTHYGPEDTEGLLNDNDDSMSHTSNYSTVNNTSINSLANNPNSTTHTADGHMETEAAANEEDDNDMDHDARDTPVSYAAAMSETNIRIFSTISAQRPILREHYQGIEGSLAQQLLNQLIAGTLPAGTNYKRMRFDPRERSIRLVVTSEESQRWVREAVNNIDIDGTRFRAWGESEAPPRSG